MVLIKEIIKKFIVLSCERYFYFLCFNYLGLTTKMFPTMANQHKYMFYIKFYGILFRSQCWLIRKMIISLIDWINTCELVIASFEAMYFLICIELDIVRICYYQQQIHEFKTSLVIIVKYVTVLLGEIVSIYTLINESAYDMKFCTTKRSLTKKKGEKKKHSLMRV